MENNIYAKIVADSVNSKGDRITSFELNMPRIILAEFNTHRSICRNSGSSRAIPLKKGIEMVNNNPFIPISWQKDHKGMQGTEYFTDEEDIAINQRDWLRAKRSAVESAEILSKSGVTKQLCNRLLEPFMMHKVIATATEWENFFALRAHDAAEIHIQDLAYKMLNAMNESSPKELKDGEWHIPFGDNLDDDRIYNELLAPNNFDRNQGRIDQYKIQIATARCARVSYFNFEGKDDYAADLNLYNRLFKDGHMSPFEHCAKAMNEGEYNYASDVRQILKESDGLEGEYRMKTKSSGWSGNFKGFSQLRKSLMGENKKENRLIK